MLTDLPTVSFDEVYHVGTLNIADRQVWSYEGDGLSVSIHPDEWAQIAKLPGATWVLRKDDCEPFVFVSWHDLTDHDRQALREWARAHRWVTQRTVYRLSWFDPDQNAQVSQDFNTLPEAEAEAEFLRDEDFDPSVTPTMVWRATETFPMQRIVTECDPTDLLLSLYVRETLPDVDGVWWNDEFDPYGLSCPRGALVRDASGYIRHQR